ncbi:MAG: glycosyltransferase [Candidatus Heimdallarchaeota archaeon]|nr:glycosyltransferase [Candidatus Heimdallarchaeota archaeon]MCK5049444.1 glycosyltransferase [Candidatus Heimdallarchaeota archaeon]
MNPANSLPTKDNDFTIILPTFNEQKNISKMIRTLSEIVPGVHIIVSDDGSIDGTKEDVLALEEEFPNVFLLDRTEKETHGLVISVIEAIEMTKTKYFMVQDADFQHPPEKQLDALEKLEEGFDIVVGVRERVEDWPFHRKLMSKVAGIMGRLSLKIRRKTSCSDLMSGLFGGQTVVVQSIISSNRKTFSDKGYKVFFDILKVAPRDLTIGEFKYIFKNREFGESKIGSKVIWEYFKSLF